MIDLRDDLARCRSCDAPIVWALTRKGRLMPVDFAPTTEGNLRLDRRADGELLVEVVARRGEAVRFRPHFATCPDARGWRR